MPRPERPLDPADGPLARFATGLRELRRAAGNPGYRELARRAHFSATTLSDAAGGRRLPSLPVTLAFVRACGRADAVDAWAERWWELDRALRAAGVAVPRCPYPGLAAYTGEDADLFFGRAGPVRKVLDLLADHRYVAVLGSSGSGKTSLLRAGVLPRLAPADEVVLMVPGVRPVAELERAVAAAGAGPDRPVVVDQFEDVFTRCTDAEERRRFVAALLAMVGPPSHGRVLLAMRADSYGACAAYPDLATAMERSHVLVGPMGPADVREAVVGPARRAGLSVEEDLVATVTAATQGRPGVLPLVSHAMREAWHRRRGGVITLAGYQASGGIEGAVAQTAERIYGAWDPARQRLGRELLTRLVDVGERHDVRRRVVPAADLPDDPAAAAVLAELAAARLVTVGENTVEIVHEALFNAWPRLRKWIDEDGDWLRTHRQVVEAAAAWRAVGHDPGALYRGVRLASVQDSLPRLGPAERRFVEASAAAVSGEQRLRRRRVRAAVSVLSAVLAVVSALSVAVVVQSRGLRAERDLAESRQLVATARAQLDLNPELALALAEFAWRQRPSAAADVVLRQATADSRLRTTVVEDTMVFAVAASGDGRLVATANAAGKVTIRDATDGRPAFTLRRGRGPLFAVAFSADGERVAAGGEDGTVRVWDLFSRAVIRSLQGHRGTVRSIDFSPDGRSLASAAEDGTVRLWDLAGDAPPHVLTDAGVSGRGVTFSPDGRHVAAGGRDAVLLWTRSGRDRPRRFAGHDGAVNDVAFSPDGALVAGAGQDGTARVWPIAGGPEVVLAGHANTVETVRFSPDGTQVATASKDGTARVWDAGRPGRPLVLRSAGGAVWAATFTADGNRLVSVSDDGGVRLWAVNAQAEAGMLAKFPGAMLTKFPGAVDTVSVGTDGRQIASGGADGTVRVTDVTSGVSAVLPRHPGGTTSAVLTPDGRSVISGGMDGTIDRSSSRGGRPAVLRKRDGAVWGVAVSPDGRQVASAGRDFGVWLSDLAGHQAETRLAGHGAAVRTVVFSPDGATLASGSWDGTVRLWRAVGAAGPVGQVRRHDGPVTALAFSSDGRRLASGGSDGTVRLGDPHGGEPPVVLRGTYGAVSAVTFSHDGRWLAASGGDGNLRLWDVAAPGEPLVLSRSGAAVRALAFHPDGRLVTAHEDGAVRIWRCAVCGTTAQVLELARSRLTTPLTDDDVRAYLKRPVE